MHNLMVLAGSALAARHAAGEHQPLAREAYAAAAGEFLARLRPDMVISRLVADPGQDGLVAPEWAREKDATLCALADYLEQNALRQGDKCQSR